PPFNFCDRANATRPRWPGSSGPSGPHAWCSHRMWVNPPAPGPLGRWPLSSTPWPPKASRANSSRRWPVAKQSSSSSHRRVLDHMTVRSVPFFSDRHLLYAEIHLPEGANAAAPCPVIVACSGFEGLKTIHPERFARVFTPRGYAVLAFDYRGFGFSEGERGRIVAQEWTEDVRAAVGMLSTIPEID